ncbi:hypothetical protein [Streptomyces sp. NPDC059708]|uniref:hypothetical protein n=1 Tax=Streptomyces sp. NPDC059708 TaxID=3346916 RepID=UPI00368B6D73
MVVVQAVAMLLLLVSAAGVYQKWVAAKFWSAYAYLLFGGGLGVGMMLFAGDIWDVIKPQPL